MQFLKQLNRMKSFIPFQTMMILTTLDLDVLNEFDLLIDLNLNQNS